MPWSRNDPYRGDLCSIGYGPITTTNKGGNTEGKGARVCDPRGRHNKVPQLSVCPDSGRAQKEDIG